MAYDGAQAMAEVLAVNAAFRADGLHTTPVTGSLGVTSATPTVTFFTALAANGNGVVDWGGGPGVVDVYGVWGTATLQLAFSADGGVSYADIEGATGPTDTGIPANSVIPFELGAGKLKLTLANAGGGTSLTAKALSTR